MAQLTQPKGHTASPGRDVATTWARDRRPLIALALLGFSAASLAGQALSRGDLGAELVWVSVSLALLGMAGWVSGYAGGGGLRVALAGIAATAASTYYAHGIPTSIAAVVALTLVLLAGGTYRRKLRARDARLRWLAAGLLSHTRDARPAHEVLMPPRSGSGLYPIVWRQPADLLLHEEKTRDRIVALIDDRLAARHELVDVAPGTSRIQLREEAPASTDSDDPDQPRDLVRLQEAATSVIGPGAIVGDVSRGEDGELKEAAVTWPVQASARLSTPAGLARATRSLTRVLPGEWVIRWHLTEDRGALERIEPLPELLPHKPRTPELGEHMVALGEDRAGTTCWDLDDAEPHVLVGGRTRAGKSVFIRTLSVQLGHPDIGALMTLIDPKRAGLRGLEYLPGVTGRYTPRDMDAMIQAITRVYDEMNKRYDQLDDGLDRAELQRLVLVIDEGRVLYEITKEHWNLVEKPAMVEAAKDEGGPKPTGTEHPVMEKVRGILRLGGEAKINVVLISQQADADWLSTEARQNFGVRVALGDPDDEARGMLFGKSAILPKLPRKASGDPIKGRAWVSVGGGQPRQVQTYWTPSLHASDLRNPDDRAIIDALGIDLPGLEPAPAAAEAESEESAAPVEVEVDDDLDEVTERGDRPPPAPSDRPAAGGLPSDVDVPKEDDSDVDVPDEATLPARLQASKSSRHLHVVQATPEEPAPAAAVAGARGHTTTDAELELVAPSTPQHRPAAGGLPEEVEDDDEDSLEEMRVDELVEGSSADLGEGLVRVLAVDPDENDDALVEVTYEGADGAAGVIALDRDEVVSASLP